MIENLLKNDEDTDDTPDGAVSVFTNSGHTFLTIGANCDKMQADWVKIGQIVTEVRAREPFHVEPFEVFALVAWLSRSLN